MKKRKSGGRGRQGATLYKGMEVIKSMETLCGWRAKHSGEGGSGERVSFGLGT